MLFKKSFIQSNWGWNIDTVLIDSSFRNKCRQYSLYPIVTFLLLAWLFSKKCPHIVIALQFFSLFCKEFDILKISFMTEDICFKVRLIVNYQIWNPYKWGWGSEL